MDIALDPKGDLYISPQGDIALTDSVAQKIRIRLLWLAGEWCWDKEEGLPYREELFVKNPDTDSFARQIRETIFEIEGVIGVQDVSVFVDVQTRKASIRYIVLTEKGTIKEGMVLGV